MAIGTTPLFSKISGSVGPVDYRTRRNGKIEIGKKRIPANPQSTEQQNTRNAYGRLHELWQNAAWIDKARYEVFAKNEKISAWNLFLKQHLPVMRFNPLVYLPSVEGINNTLHDLTINNNHGTISGASWTSPSYSPNHALNYDGVDDFTTIPNSPIFNITNKLWVSAWVNMNYITGNRRILSRDTSIAPNRSFILHTESGFPNFYIFTKGVANSSGTATTDLRNTGWHMVTGINNGSHLYILIDGEIENSSMLGGLVDNSSANILIGKYKGVIEQFKGEITNSYACDVAPTTSVISQIFQHQRKYYGV